MLNGMLDAVKGCLKEEMRMDCITNNLANASVIGFKKDRITFQEALIQAGSADGTSLFSTETDFLQGDTRQTGNSLDFAIYGPGFFRVKTPEGIRYTRKGNFTLDPVGTLITQDGYQVLGKSGPITIDGTRINADGSGTILVDGAEAGQLDLVNFDRPKLLTKDGNGHFMMTDGVRQTPPPTQTMISQGYVELSNVEVAEEMVQMIHSLRAFESYQKIIQILDGVNQRAINEVSRVH